MKNDNAPIIAGQPTLGHVLEGLSANRDLSDTRRRDLRSAVNCFAALTNTTPSFIPLDLGAIRSVLDLMVPIQAKVSRKRWANLRSDLAAAIAASDARASSSSALVTASGTIQPSRGCASIIRSSRCPCGRTGGNSVDK